MRKIALGFLAFLFITNASEASPGICLSQCQIDCGLYVIGAPDPVAAAAQCFAMVNQCQMACFSNSGCKTCHFEDVDFLEEDSEHVPQLYDAHCSLPPDDSIHYSLIAYLAEVENLSVGEICENGGGS